MQTLRSRRDFLACASLAGVASLLGPGESFAQEAPLETTTVRIPTGTLICNAPTYIADELLRAEGFTDIQHVPVTPERAARPELMESSGLDFAMAYTPPLVAAIDAGTPATVLAGVHVGCNSLFAHEGIRSIRDLKGKKVGAGPVPQPLIASMAAYVGLNPTQGHRVGVQPVRNREGAFRRAQDRRVPRLAARPTGPARAQDRACHRRQRARPAVVAALLLRASRQQGVCSQTPGGDQACAARKFPHSCTAKKAAMLSLLARA